MSLKANFSLVPAFALLIALSGQSALPQRPSFLGYEVGEERRYVLGPPEELFEGEIGSWSIHLRELFGEPPEGIFELAHEWQRGQPALLSETPLGTITRVKSEGELRVNGHGFPTELTFKTERHLAGLGGEVYSIRYRFEDGKFVKHIAMEGKDLEHTAMIRGHEHLDRSVPSGLYALIPTTLDCSIPPVLDPRQAARVTRTRPTAGTPSAPAVPRPPAGFADNRLCLESLFANPGLLTLLMPALWEEGTGEREFLLFTPAGPFGMPGVSLGGQAGGVTAAAGGSGFDFSRAARPDTNSDVERLKYLERVEVRVGARTRDAWLFDRMGGFEAIYVDDENVVLRVDLSPILRGLSVGGSVASLNPTQLRRRNLLIRLLFPSEY